MSSLLMLKGLPGSGKSTFAKTLVDKGWVRVNKDDLRSMLHNSKWSKSNEKVILKLRDEAVRASLSQGKSVVVDDTNFEPKHAETLSKIAKSYNANFSTRFFDTKLEECIANDLKRPNSVGEPVIREMYNKYLRKIDKPKKVEGKVCIIVDIDGTIAHMKDRSPYDWDRVDEDERDQTVIAVAGAAAGLGENVAKSMHETTFETIVVSGRDDSCREKTEKWLKDNHVVYEKLFMRPKGDMRKDTLIKEEIYEREINGKYLVWCVFDDRDQVVEMWRNKGLKVFQVAEGAF